MSSEDQQALSELHLALDRFCTSFTPQQIEELKDSEARNLLQACLEKSSSVQALLLPPLDRVVRSMFGYIDTACLKAAVDHGVFDQLASRPQGVTLDELAGVSHTHPDRLGQVLGVLRGNGLLRKSSENCFELTAAGQLLARTHWTQWVTWVEFFDSEFYTIFSRLSESLAETEPRSASQISWNTQSDFYTFLHRSGKMPAFHKALGAGGEAQLPGMLAHYPWHRHRGQQLVDLGGGQGTFLACILRQHPDMRGTLFDLPEVVENAKTLFFAVADKPSPRFHDVHARVSFEAGDFFVKVPSSSLYAMKWTLHNWDDESSLKILSVIRSGIQEGPDARLLIVENVVDGTEAQRPARYGDMVMLASCNGKERTKEQWSALFDRSRWQLEHVWSVQAIASIMELSPK